MRMKWFGGFVGYSNEKWFLSRKFFMKIVSPEDKWFITFRMWNVWKMVSWTWVGLLITWNGFALGNGSRWETKKTESSDQPTVSTLATNNWPRKSHFQTKLVVQTVRKSTRNGLKTVWPSKTPGQNINNYPSIKSLTSLWWNLKEK